MCRRDVADLPLSIRRRVMDGAFVLIVLAAAGCIQEMSDQPRYDPLEPLPAVPGLLKSPMAPVAGTIARGHLDLDQSYSIGRDRDGSFAESVPERALASRSPQQLVERGHERFNIYCANCHGRVGGGIGGGAAYEAFVGMVVRAGYPAPPTFHQPRLREARLGHFVNVIALGQGRMPAHGYLVAPDDRWAIAAYIRALQLSQDCLATELTAADRAKLGSNPEGAAP